MMPEAEMLAQSLGRQHACVQAGELPTTISVVARRRDVPRVGEEVNISYGDKSNEELLLLYGTHFHHVVSLQNNSIYQCQAAD